MKLAILTGLFALLCSMGYTQSRLVHGRLTAFNQFPVARIEVFSKKAKSVAISDSLGWFSIECMEKDVIRIRPEVYRNVRLKVDKSVDTVDINLVYDDNHSNREIVTGYGYISEKDLTFASGHLQQQNNEFCDYSDIFDLLEGRFAGVDVIPSSGTIRIRGISSTGTDTDALLVVDGIISDDISWIVPCEVKSVDIIKDGMAAIYGSRGGNGVVVIETIPGSMWKKRIK